MWLGYLPENTPLRRLRALLRLGCGSDEMVQLKVRLDEVKACVLVMVGVRADGGKELIALDEGYRESGESWANMLRDCVGAACAP